MIDYIIYAGFQFFMNISFAIHLSPSCGEQGQWLSLKEISASLRQVFKGAK